MNIKSLTLSIITLSAASAIVVNPANAQGKSGARFNFAPNYWHSEEPKVPEVSHSVKSGSVPTGSNFLGLDPAALEKPKPQPQPQVVLRPVTTQVFPKIQFNSAFGQPATPPAQKAAISPVTAKPKALAHMPAKKMVAYRGHHTTSVNGKLMKRNKQQAPNALDAAGNQMASYDKNIGYAPGTYLPAQSGQGLQARADVFGRLLKN